jgi:hypothetical protein
LKAVQQTAPGLPTKPYIYGALPFAVDWEVFRVNNRMPLNLDEAESWQSQHLHPNGQSPRIIWDHLRKRAEETAIGEFTMPERTSNRVYESLAEKGWTDGHVHLSLKLIIPAQGPISYVVQPMKYSSSRRAYRRFGSDRFISISIPKTGERGYQKRPAVVSKFFSEPLHICGRTYQVFFVKDSKQSLSVHYFATHGAGLENAEWSRNALLQWLISLEKNKDHSAAKLWSRISLSLSSTTPSVVFAPEEIRLVSDVESVYGECMTDGCAKASPAVFKAIWHTLASKEMPTAIQGRIGGAKGVWYLDPEADLRSEEKWVEVRPSQLKLKHDKAAFCSDEMLRTLVLPCFIHFNFAGYLQGVSSQFWR